MTLTPPSSHSSGGGSQPITYENFSGVSLALAGTGDGSFNFTTAAGITPAAGNANLLDLANPTAPLVRVAGTYSVAFTAAPDDGAHVGKYLVVEAAILNSDAAQPRSYQTTEMAGPGGGFAWAGITSYANAGDAIQVYVLHDIGVSTVFDINVYVQRLA